MDMIRRWDFIYDQCPRQLIISLICISVLNDPGAIEIQVGKWGAWLCLKCLSLIFFLYSSLSLWWALVAAHRV